MHQQWMTQIRTVCLANSSLLVGTLFPGSQPHPAILPPGVWYSLKLSASPTLVTWPNRPLRRKYCGLTWFTVGMRRRYVLYRRTPATVDIVNARDGIRVRGSIKELDQSVGFGDAAAFVRSSSLPDQGHRIVLRAKLSRGKLVNESGVLDPT
jgi:hypothetical protein